VSGAAGDFGGGYPGVTARIKRRQIVHGLISEYRRAA
jgi:hypothetical protein